jgi:dTDP-4-dehydrorhamnose reductase
LGRLVLWGRGEADFSRPRDIEAKLDAVRPDLIVNAAAWTKVALAESRAREARLVNFETPAVLASWAGRKSALLVHYSTDYVFDGTKDSPYSETDVANPLNVYGRT